jgi:hypothetical protein
MEKDMTMRKEFVFEVLDALEALNKKATTEGERKLMYELAVILQDCLSWEV